MCCRFITNDSEFTSKYAYLTTFQYCHNFFCIFMKIFSFKIFSIQICLCICPFWILPRKDKKVMELETPVENFTMYYKLFLINTKTFSKVNDFAEKWPKFHSFLLDLKILPSSERNFQHTKWDFLILWWWWWVGKMFTSLSIWNFQSYKFGVWALKTVVNCLRS